MTLLEKYSKRLQFAESMYSDANNGAHMDNTRKVTLATLLNNTEKFLNEAFDNSVGTQRADFGLYKKFCLNLTNVVLPNLIAPDLVIVHPMTSMSGNVAYLEYVAGSNKGDVEQGDLFNSPFKQGDYDKDYTSDRVVETAAAAGEYTVSWTPVVKGTFGEGQDVKITHIDGTVGYAEVDAKTGKIVGNVNVGDRIAYCYDNVVIPQNDLPILNARLKNIPLFAKPRRIAIYYSQMAAYQAKTDYGFDLGDQLAEQAVGQLSYEIDIEVVDLLSENAARDTELVWSKTLPIGVSKRDHYAGFAEIVELGKKYIYRMTKKFAPNYMLAAPEVIPVLALTDQFKAASTNNISGPYYAGSYCGLKVYVSPKMMDGEFVLGVNGNDLMTSAAVYAPYMAIVPTQLLGFADGSMSQGWSTLYDLKILNKDLLVKGQITA